MNRSGRILRAPGAACGSAALLLCVRLALAQHPAAAQALTVAYDAGPTGIWGDPPDREEAKRVFTQIENCSLLTAEVRKTCVELKERIAAPAAEGTEATKPAKPVRPSAKAS